MPKQGCPGVDELMKLVSGGKVSVRLARHIEDCDRCGDVLVALKADASLLADLRAAFETSDDRKRRHVLALCEKVAAKSIRRRRA